MTDIQAELDELKRAVEELRQELGTKGVPIQRPPMVRVRANPYEMASDAIHAAIQYGWNRAHKHTDNPPEDAILSNIHTNVMGALCDVFDFETGQDG